MPLVTASIIVVNVLVFLLELTRGDAFVMRWSAIPAQILSGHHWITVFTAMFMHGSWSHILGNMIFLWAFGPEIEDSMGPGRYLVFYLTGGLAATLAQVLGNPHSTIPNLGASGAIAAQAPWWGPYFLYGAPFASGGLGRSAGAHGPAAGHFAHLRDLPSAGRQHRTAAPRDQDRELVSRMHRLCGVVDNARPGAWPLVVVGQVTGIRLASAASA